MTPIERAVMAIEDMTGWGADGEPHIEIVRAVLQAIREPSEAMISAANSAPGKPTHAVSSGLWVRMIDAALAEGI